MPHNLKKYPILFWHLLGKVKTKSHCVLLEHYYSVDFTWWFHRIFLCLSFLNSNWENLWNQSVKKVTQMIWQNFSVLALKNVSKTFKSIWKPNPWMYYISFHSSFWRTSPFHREWPQLVAILTSFGLPFEEKFK